MEILRVFKHSFVYGLTGITSTVASVLLVPIYTRVLTPEDYGVIAILRTLTSILIILLNLGMSSAIFWAYFRAEGDEEKREVVGTALLFQFLFLLVSTLVLVIGSYFFNKLIFPEGQPGYYLIVAFITIFFQAGITLPLAILRAKEQSRRYVLLTLSNLILTIGFSIWLVVFLRLGVLGVLLASLISSVLVYSGALPFIIRYAKLTISFEWLKDMLSFGLPMVPSGLSLWVLNSSDRYFLNYFRDLSEVGIYNVGYRVGMLLVLIVSAVQLAYPPFMFSIAKRKDAKEIYKKFATYYFLLLFFIALGLAVLSREAVIILTGPKFHSAYTVIPFIAFAYVGFGLFNTFATGVSVVKKTIYSFIAVFLASAANVILNFLLIPQYGIIGAASSTVLSFTLLMIFMYNFSQRVYPIDYELGRMAKIIIVGAAIYFVGSQINLALWPAVVLKSILLLSYLPLLYIFGFFNENERKKLLYLLKSVKFLKEDPKKALTMIKEPFQKI